MTDSEREKYIAWLKSLQEEPKTDAFSSFQPPLLTFNDDMKHGEHHVRFVNTTKGTKMCQYDRIAGTNTYALVRVELVT